jgi:glycopeptide antibiotics resistance protein
LTQLVRVFHQLVPMALLALAAGFVLIIAVATYRIRGGRTAGEAWGTAILDVLLLLTAATIAVLTLPPGLESHRVVELVPFQDIRRTLRETSVSDTQFWAMVANVLLFVPVGALVPLRFPRFDRLSRVLLLCAGISAGIEVIQFVVGSHSTATDDVMLNTLGGLLGFLAMRGVRALLRRLPAMASRDLRPRPGRSLP